MSRDMTKLESKERMATAADTWPLLRVTKEMNKHDSKGSAMTQGLSCATPSKADTACAAEAKYVKAWALTCFSFIGSYSETLTEPNTLGGFLSRHSFDGPAFAFSAPLPFQGGMSL